MDAYRARRPLEGHDGGVNSLALSKDNKVYSGSRDATIRVWSAVDGSHLGTLEGHGGDVSVVVVAVDGTVYSGSDDGTLRMWSGHDGSPIRTLQIGGAVITIAIGAGTVLIGEREGRVSAWNGGAAPARTLYTFTEPVNGMAIGQDGRLFVTCSSDVDVHKVYAL
jgi:WD40 repeat protein